VTALRILSYNMGLRDAPPTRRRAQLKFLRALAPDVLCVQGLWDDSPSNGRFLAGFDAPADVLGLDGQVVPAPRSQSDVGLLWRPDVAQIDSTTYQRHLRHGAGTVTLDVGAKVPLRIGVTHLDSCDPEHRLGEARAVAHLADPGQATVVAADWSCIGEDPAYDLEPDWRRLRPDQIEHHVLWRADPDAPRVTDRRPAQLLHRAGLVDAARHLGAAWQPIAGHQGIDVLRRIDAFRVSAAVLPALESYQVHASPMTRRLSEHLPIELRLDLARLGDG
jgi:endonuclease/exonuclease/phosphatase family metal-dependent hydrolase